MLNGFFNRPKQNPEQEKVEYIQYAQEVESTLRHLEAQLHESDSSEEIIQDENLIGKQVYYFTHFPNGDTICIVDFGGSFAFYVFDSIV